MMYKVFNQIVKYVRFYGGKYRCNVCGRRIINFFPFSESLSREASLAGFPYSFKRMETLNFDMCNCPFCLASDRERLYLLFLSYFFNSRANSPKKVLDFAPSKSFSKALRAFPFIQYSSADFLSNDFDLRLDICDMRQLNDNIYDIVICSHVLEHVFDPDRAISEIYRILKPGSFAIVMVPLFWDVPFTLENETYNSDMLRTKFYGQRDHVRLFSKNDFVDRLSKVGFNVEQINSSWFKRRDITKYAISDNSILYVCYRT